MNSSYEVKRSDEGKSRIVLRNAAANCMALEAAPASRESELNKGRWLVMAFAAWNLSDVEQIATALEVAAKLAGSINVGIRPFDDPAELQSWIRADIEVGQTPHWIVLRDGVVTSVLGGRVSVDRLVQASLGTMVSATEEPRDE